MSPLGLAARALYGAYRLARFDTAGLQYFDITALGFWHSFRAAIIVFPFYAATMAARWTTAPEALPGWRFLSVELIAYVIAWTAYPVIMPLITRALEREQHYTRAIVTYNWAAVLQNLIYTPVAVLGMMGAQGAGPLAMVALFAVMLYSWFVTKTALEISSAAAWGIVALDLLISMVLSFWADTLLQV